MTDYKDAFKVGLESAKEAARARKEISSVLEDFSEQIRSMSGGKVIVVVEEREARSEDPFATIALPFGKKDTYQALVACNPGVKAFEGYELAIWEPSSAGYPCKLTWGGNSVYCEDKEGLQSSLAELIADGRSGERILYVMSLKPDHEGAGSESS